MDKGKKTFLMVDGSSLIFRAFYAIRHLTSKDGIATNGVYGFLNMYLKAVEDIKPDYIMVAFDRAEKNFRVEDYEAYKANRQETPSELSAQFGILKELLQLMGIKSLDMAGYEADDIVATVARMASEEKINSYLLTGDRDYFQLVDPYTRVLFTKKGISRLEIIDEEKIYQDYGLKAIDLIEVKGLMGDKSDNIPGVKGVGEKTAIKLVKEYGSIEKIYENIDSIAGKKLKENLIEEKETAFLSRKLGTIYRQVPLDMEISDFIPGEIDKEKLQDRFERLNFKSLADRFEFKKKGQLIEEEAILTDSDDWKELADRIKKEKNTSFVVLGDKENYIYANPIFLAFFIDEKAYLLDIRQDEVKFKEIFSEIFSSNIKFSAYDIKESIVLLSSIGMNFTADYQDLMLMEYLLDPNRSSYDPADLAGSRLGLKFKARSEILGKGAKRQEFNQIEVAEVKKYVYGLLKTLELAEPILSKEIKDNKMEYLFDEIENPLASVLAGMEIQGIMIDKQALDRIDEKVSRDLEKATDRIYDLAGCEFNINSPKQLGDILFEDMGLPHGKKTKTGYSTAADLLEKMKDIHPIIAEILNYRKLSKLKSTYIDGFRPHIYKDGRVRSIFRQNVAATGRISSTEPNLQNIPVRTDEGRELRSIFIAADDNLLADCDYSQIELRLLASFSGDEKMIEAFKHGEDIHKKTAAQVNHISIDQVTDLERSRAKAVNFGIIYGISDYGLSQDLNISRAEAKEYIDKYKAGYPDVKLYMEKIIEKAKKDGYVDTAFGRRRQIPELKSRNFNIRSFGERIALNTPIQGTAADLIKLAMIRVDRALKEKYPKAKLILQIHDELIVECPEEIADQVGLLVKEEMEKIGDFAVDLLADLHVGKSWYDIK